MILSMGLVQALYVGQHKALEMNHLIIENGPLFVQCIAARAGPELQVALHGFVSVT